MDAYSALLAAAIALAGAAWVALLLRRLGVRRLFDRRIVIGAAAAALGLDAGSTLVHLLTGHAPGTERALPPLEFIGEHPAFWAVAAAALAALWLARRF